MLLRPRLPPATLPCQGTASPSGHSSPAIGSGVEWAQFLESQGSSTWLSFHPWLGGPGQLPHWPTWPFGCFSEPHLSLTSTWTGPELSHFHAGTGLCCRICFPAVHCHHLPHIKGLCLHLALFLPPRPFTPLTHVTFLALSRDKRPLGPVPSIPCVSLRGGQGPEVPPVCAPQTELQADCRPEVPQGVLLSWRFLVTAWTSEWGC